MTALVRSSVLFGAYAAGQYHAQAVRRDHVAAQASGTMGVIGCRSHGGLPIGYVITPFDDEPCQIAGSDTPMAAVWPSLGGDTYGNLASVGTDGYMDKAWAYLTGTLGCRTDKVGLFGASEGGLDSLNWARLHPTLVACVALSCAVTDLTVAHGVYEAEVDAAYTNHAGYLAALPTHSPIQFAASLSAIPIKFWYASDDPTVTPTQVTDFAAAHGNTTLVNMGAVGHTVQAAPGVDVAAWFAAHV